MKYTGAMRWLAVIWTIVILVGCLTPHEDIPGPLVTWNDKALHVAIFAPFSFLWMQAGFRINKVLIAGVLLGGLIEALQGLLPINRSADWGDLLADCLGIVVGAGLAMVWSRLFLNRNF